MNMNNIMLSKKELIPLLVLLICVCLYFVYEYFVNQPSNRTKEDFKSNENVTEINAKELHNLKMINLNLFTNFKNFLLKEKEYFRNDLDIANFFISKKFNLEKIISTSKLVNDEKQLILNQKMSNLFDLRKSYLKGMIRDLQSVENNINQIDEKNEFYIHFLTIVSDLKSIYEDTHSYFVEENDNYLNIEKIIDEISNPQVESKTSATQSVMPSYMVESFTDGKSVIENLNSAFILSRDKLKNLSDNLEATLKRLRSYLEKESKLDKTIRVKFANLVNNRFNITLKKVVRNLSFDFIESIVQLVYVDQLSNNIISEKSNAARESNLVVREIIELINLEITNTDDLISFFNQSNKGSILTIDNEFKYFNTVEKNTNTLINFCKKMKKIDKPKNNNYLFKRLSKEFIKKKNNQIEKLENEINQLMGEMTVTDAYNHNLYTLRTSDEAQKQINAIKKAKENIDSIGKFKINIK